MGSVVYCTAFLRPFALLIPNESDDDTGPATLTITIEIMTSDSRENTLREYPQPDSWESVSDVGTAFGADHGDEIRPRRRLPGNGHGAQQDDRSA